jgi:membrane carboxypeptidase/penicillin-binding protein PbpC
MLPGVFLRKAISASLGLVVLAGGLYLGAQVLDARRRTPLIVAAALGSPGMILEVGDFTPLRLRTLLQVEDPNFFLHHGVDLITPGAGLTTLTQGLVKQLYFRHFQPGPMKIPQTLIAYCALDPLVDKQTQLRLFINRVYLGRAGGVPVYGFAAAAQTYFHKAFRNLSDREYLALVAMIIAPDTFNVAIHPEANQDRSAHIQRLLAGEYRPKGLMDLYYGGKTFRKDENTIRRWWDRLIWGY